MERDDTMREMFFSWLSTRVVSNKLSDFKKIFNLIDDYCEKNDILEKPLFETTDPEALSFVIQRISLDWEFKRRIAFNFDQCTTAIKFYTIFLKSKRLLLEDEKLEKLLTTVSHEDEPVSVYGIENELEISEKVNDAPCVKRHQDREKEDQKQLEKSQEILEDTNMSDVCKALLSNNNSKENVVYGKKKNGDFTNQQWIRMIPQKNFFVKNLIESEYFDYICCAICRRDLMTKRSILQEKYSEKEKAQIVLEQSVSDRKNAKEKMQALDCRIMEIVGEVDERKKDIDELTKEIISLQQELGETFVFSFGRRKNIKKKIKVIEDQLVEEERKIVELVSEQENLENESKDELVETLEHRVDHQKNRVVALEDAIKHFERDIDDINLKLCDLEEKVRCHIRVKKKAEEARRAEEERKAEEARHAEEERKAGKTCLIEEERKVKEAAHLEAVIRRTLVNNDKREKEKLKNDRFMETIRKAEEVRQEKIRETEEVGRAEEAGCAKEERTVEETCFVEEAEKEGEVPCTENERTDETSCFIEENNRLFYDFEPFDEDETDPPYYKLYRLNPENYYGIRIESLDFSVRLENRLKKYGTLGNLLMQNDRSLCEIKGFGKVCVEELHKYFANLNKNISLTSLQDNPKRQDAVLSLTDELIPFKEQIKHGDFSFLVHTEINDQSLKMIDQFKYAYELIDPELIKKSIEGDSEIISVLQMLYKFINDVETLKKAEVAIKNIPVHRLEEHVLWIMKCYSSNEETIEYLRTFCTEDHQTLGEFLFANREQIVHNNPVFVHLIKWCQYNLTEDINSFFVDRVKNERDLEIVRLRAAHKKLEEIGNKLNITRERVRQLENKTRDRFDSWQQRQRMMFKIFLEMGEKNGLSSMEVEDFLGTYGKEFVYLMKECEIDDLKYKEEFDMFVIEDLSLNEKIQDYVDALPDEFPAKKLEEFLQIAEKENNYPAKLVLAVIEERYGKTGDLYHRFNLTLASMYGNIMKRYYPAGMHIYDPATINDFRDHIMTDYGRDISDKSDRSIVAILARIGILCGRGIYKYRTEKSYISEKLATQIHDYIENSQAPIFMTNTLFSIFEEELLAEGIDNKYYLQGVLKDRYEKEWIFRRDYISKDESYTTIHSS
ncbi:MAG: DNA-directed RNA polymerase subunit alpha C-terminal domain-containing protein, partial [Peptococcaceae bacterium]|nr:DNA-directed RNA polymerase subunit alpha C-terminal domain-containing protein [Peptococcaceae bacterium]